MRLKIFLILIVVLCGKLSVLGQASQLIERKTYFSEQIYLYHKEYTYKAKRAYKIGKEEVAASYYNQLLNNYLIGSYMDNFSASCLNTKKCCIDDYERPMILMTYASWTVPTKGEIPALNEIVTKYKNEVDFVVLFWDQRSDVRKVAKNYNKNIHIIYVDELKNRDAHIIKMLKHSIGFPTSFVIGSNKKILEIQHNPQIPLSTPIKEAALQSFENIESLVTQLLDYETKISNY
jgi:thiol-disulfide isomerase/thioredoxin